MLTETINPCRAAHNALLVAVFALLVAWNGSANHQGWVIDNNGESDACVITLNKPGLQDNSDAGYVSSELTLVALSARASAFHAPVPAQISGAPDRPYAIRAPPRFPIA